jgi:hypothetical protein
MLRCQRTVEGQNKLLLELGGREDWHVDVTNPGDVNRAVAFEYEPVDTLPLEIVNE